VILESDKNFSNFIEPERFSSWQKLLRTVTFMVLFCKKIQKSPILFLEKVEEKEDFYHATQVARNFLLRQAQIDICKADVAKWNLVKGEDNLFKVFARLSNVNAPVQHPVFLPRGNYITKLLILDAHKISLHSGVSHTISVFRENFWVERVRTIVQRLLFKECNVCKRANAKPFILPQFLNLSSERVNRAIPFAHTGLDLAGPFFVRDSDGKLIKRWIVLFTCLVTRAIHLECVSSQNTFDFLNCFKRFTAHRGCPK